MTSLEQAQDLLQKFGSKEVVIKVICEIEDALSEYDDRNPNSHELQNMDGDFRYWNKVRNWLKSL
jgi:hypothetical protein